jgi:non-canonical purine NTP pyrophosphatase (RdgB/HAM1 family)
MPALIPLFLATSNPGKLREYRMMTDATGIELRLIPDFDKLPLFEESAPTFAENAAGKAMHYSHYVKGTVLADDSGLVVPALGGRPGIHSARYAGPGASDEDRVRKLLGEMEGKEGEERRARFVCVSAIAKNGRALAVVSDFVEGILTKEPRGNDGFGYDPVFFFEELGRTYSETTREEKNVFSHRGKAFRKIVKLLTSPESATSL